MSRNQNKKRKQPKELSDAEQQERERQQEMQRTLEKSLTEIEKRLQSEELPEGKRQRLKKMAEEMQAMLGENQDDETNQRLWNQMVQSDEAQTLLEAIASGESVSDEQWNKLVSTLDDGLWQVQGKQAPEAYRKAIEQYQDQIRELMQTISD